MPVLTRLSAIVPRSIPRLSEFAGGFPTSPSRFARGPKGLDCLVSLPLSLYIRVSIHTDASISLDFSNIIAYTELEVKTNAGTGKAEASY